MKNIAIARDVIGFHNSPKFLEKLGSIFTPAATFNYDGIVLGSNSGIIEKFGFVPKNLCEIILELDFSNLRAKIFNNSNISSDFFVSEFKIQNNFEKVFILNHVDLNAEANRNKHRDCYTIIFTSFNTEKIYLKKFGQMFSLTRAESEIAFELSNGFSPLDIAITREVSIQTIRTQVKAIKNKTGAPNIHSIVRIVLLFQDAMKYLDI